MKYINQEKKVIQDSHKINVSFIRVIVHLLVLLKITMLVLLKITMMFAVTFVIYGFISNATRLQNIAIGNYKIKEPWCFKKFIKYIVPFSQLSNNQINNLVLGSLIANAKQIIQENQVIFPNDK